MTPIVLPDPAALDGLEAEELVAVVERAAALQAGAMARLALMRATAPAQTTPPSGRLLTAQEAAARLGISPQTMYRRARSLPFARRATDGPRGAVRFDEVGLERWLNRRRLDV